MFKVFTETFLGIILKLSQIIGEQYYLANGSN